MEDGIYSDKERDKYLTEIIEKLKRLDEKVNYLVKKEDEKEVRINEIEKTLSQHKVWIYILTIIVTGLLSNVIGKLAK